VTTIYLVRHGQASVGKENYDQLSELGYKQASILGTHWQQFEQPHQCYAGDMVRHGQTAESFFKGLGQSHPVIKHEGFNEFDHEDVLRCYQPEWQTTKHFGDYIKQQSDPKKALLTEFSNATQRWLSGQHNDYQESFVHFKQRAIQSLFGILTEDLIDRRIMIFTSAGIISAICGYIYGLNDQELLGLNQRIVNSSVSKLHYKNNQLEIEYFNNYGCLEQVDKNHVTLV